MVMRKKTKAQEMAELKNEMETRLAFLESATRELNTLLELSKKDKLSKKHEKRALELEEFVYATSRWLEISQERINEFLRPPVAEPAA